MNNGAKFRCNVLSCAAYTIPFNMCGNGTPFGRVGEREGGRGIKERKRGREEGERWKGGAKKEGGGKKGRRQKKYLFPPPLIYQYLIDD